MDEKWYTDDFESAASASSAIPALPKSVPYELGLRRSAAVLRALLRGVFSSGVRLRCVIQYRTGPRPLPTVGDPPTFKDLARRGPFAMAYLTPDRLPQHAVAAWPSTR